MLFGTKSTLHSRRAVLPSQHRPANHPAAAALGPPWPAEELLKFLQNTCVVFEVKPCHVGFEVKSCHVGLK
jgi:hypothetical protein